MDKETVMLWELMQAKIDFLAEVGVTMDLNTNEKFGFIIDIHESNEAYVLESLKEVKAFIRGLETSISLKLGELAK